MKRPLWRRVAALLVGLWFVAVSAGPDLVHACPMHGSHASASTPGASHSDHEGDHEGALAPVAASGHHGASSSGSAPASGAQCTCLGHCSGTAPVGFISASIALAASPTAAARDAGLPDFAYVPVAAEHVLPLAHAPPLSA